MSKKNHLWAILFGSNKISSGSASKATNRLKVVVSNEDTLDSSHPNNSSINEASAFEAIKRKNLEHENFEQMAQEILEVVNKYIHGVSTEDVFINHRKENKLNLLEMSIDLSNH